MIIVGLGNPGTKYEKTFLAEKGWKQLCKLLYSTNFGKNATAE